MAVIILMVNYLSSGSDATNHICCFIGGIALLLSSIIYDFAVDKKDNIKRINLPEEYKDISKNINKPDTLTAYYYKDTLYLNFIPQ